MSGTQLPTVDNFATRDGDEPVTVDRSACHPAGGAVPATSGDGESRSTAAAESLVVKRKRGRPARGGGAAKVEAAPAAKKSKKEEEDVCFICFDGGKLVLCDRRDCPKAYHPACVKRDESFFKRRVRWNCGWHLCNICQRNALFMCYTCPYSLCKTCVKQADISCVRGNKGFCRICMTTIMLIENMAQGNEEVGHVDFDDTSSWEYLFKVYWIYLKQKESLTLDELSRATNPWKGPLLNYRDNLSPEYHNTCVNKTVEKSSTIGELNVNSQVETNASKRRKTRKQTPLQNDSPAKVVADKLQNRAVDWASKELLEFIAHMKNGDTSILSQFDVQALLLEYIRKNNLRDPCRKCQIICDKRLEILFGKTRVGHFEMLKLLEYHFKDDCCASGVAHAAATDSCASQIEFEECSKDAHISTRERKRQACKKLDGGGRQVNLDNYAAIDVHNMNLIYLRRSLMENLMEDVEKFHDKVVGSIVRIRIFGNDLKQDMYRLVRVVGTGKAAELYKIGERTTDIMLKILNLNKIEDILIDAISNQDFSEDECRRLRQSIKCGLVERMTVGEVQDKAIALQELRIRDVLETEILKLNHLRDRASEMGHRKQLRECVEKLEFLKSPEERQRRIHDIPEVHADPRMDPRYQSDEDSEQSDTNKQDVNMTLKNSRSNSSSELISPRRGDMSYNARAKVLRSGSSNWKWKRNVSITSHLCKEDDAAQSYESSQSSLETDAARILEELRNQVDPCRIASNHEATTLGNHPRLSDDASVTSVSSGLALSSDNTEFEKLWHYQDPSGKVQGPFCMLQLRKWNSSGYFPADLRIWRTNESQYKSLLLTDALSLQYHHEHEIPFSSYLESQQARLITDGRKAANVVQSNIKVDAVWTNDTPNEECSPDLMDAVTSSDDKKKSVPVQNNGQENLDSLPPNENKTHSRVLSSADGEVSDACLTSSDTSSATMCHNHKPECSELASSTPKADNEDSGCLAVETGQKFSASNASSHNSGSDLSLSSGAPTFPDLPSPTPDPERGCVGMKRQDSQHKFESDLNAEAEENKHSVASIVLEQSPVTDWSTTSGQTEFSDLPSQTQDEKNKDAESQVTEIKQSITAHVQGQDAGISWNTLSNRIDFPVSVSSVNQVNGAIKGLAAEHRATSNITYQDTGISWSTSTLVCGTVQWDGYSIHGKSYAEELDSGIASGSSIKFGDVACEHATVSLAICQFTDSSSIHADCNTSSWHDGPIELSTLGDESVSDLLCEVEALELEALRGMLSPISGMNFGDDSIESPSNDCFSHLVGLSPPFAPGNHDSWSSTCDMQFHSQPMTEPHAQFTVNLHDCSTSPPDSCSLPVDGERQAKAGFASAQQDCFSLTHTPSRPSPPAMNLVSSKGLESEYVKPASLPMLSEVFDSHAHPPASLCMGLVGSGIESEMKLVDGSKSMNHEFVCQHHSPEQKAELNPAYASAKKNEFVSPEMPATTNAVEDEEAIQKQELDSRVDLPLQPPLAQPPSPSSPTKLDRLSSPAEEGEVEPASLPLEVSEQGPGAHLKQPLPESNGSLETSSHGEEVKQAADLSTDQQEPASQNPPTSLQPSTPDISMNTGREPQRPIAGSSANRSSAGNCPGTTTNGHGNVHRSSIYSTANQGNRASQQPRYHGGGQHFVQKDLSYQRPSWNRQPSFNGSVIGGGGYSRPPVPSHRGQRVCKFYERGYCKKGASCNYLHP